jgi:hypothetical protein
MTTDQQLRLVILLFARWADVYTTWLVTPDLSGELNQVVRRLGWRYWIASNVLFCVVLSNLPLEACAAVATVSGLVALWNLAQWRARQ